MRAIGFKTRAAYTGRVSIEAVTRPPRVADWLRRGGLASFLVVLLLFLYRAPALYLWSAWQADPYYTHGAFVFPIAIAIGVWRLWKARAHPAPTKTPWHLAFIPAALAAYGAGMFIQSADLMVWSALALATAAALATGGMARLRMLGAPLALVALTLPTPWSLDLGLRLQDLATLLSVGLLALSGITFGQELYTLNVGGIAFEVTPLCSGFQSAVTLLAIGAVVVTLFPMSGRRRRIVLLSTIPLALALNAVRILAVVLVALRWGADAAEGFFHGASSGLLFAAETLAILGIAGLLTRRQKKGAITHG